METVIIVVHLMVVLALVGVVLLQRSEGGGLGIGGGSGFMTARGAANALTRATAILAAAFFITSLGLSLLARYGAQPIDILDRVPPAGQSEGVLDQLGGSDVPAPPAGHAARFRRGDTAGDCAAPAAPAAPDAAAGRSAGAAPAPPAAVPAGRAAGSEPVSRPFGAGSGRLLPSFRRDLCSFEHSGGKCCIDHEDSTGGAVRPRLRGVTLMPYKAARGTLRLA